MNPAIKTPGFWITLGTAVIGLCASVFGLSREDTDHLTVILGAVITLASALGYLHEETAVRVARIRAVASAESASVSASGVSTVAALTAEM